MVTGAAQLKLRPFKTPAENAGALDGDCVGGFIGEIAHDLPAEGGVGIEKPLEERGAGRVGGAAVVGARAHADVIAKGA